MAQLVFVIYVIRAIHGYLWLSVVSEDYGWVRVTFVS